MSKTHFPPTGANKWSIDRSFYINALVTGNEWYVNSATGTDAAGFGYSPESPFATLAFAISQATANNGDVVYVMAGHAETITALKSLAVAGVTVIGLPLQQTGQFPSGSTRPTFTFTTANAAGYSLDAAGISLYNLLFVANRAGQTAMVTVTATDCLIDTCEFKDGGQQPTSVISLNAAGANGNDRAAVRNCIINFPNAGATRAIFLNQVADRVIIENNRIWGDWSTAGIHNPAATVCTDLQINLNDVTNLHAATAAINIVSASTGMCYGNQFYGTVLGSITTLGSLNCAGNLENTNAGTNDAVPTPAAPLVNNAVGAVFTVKKTVTSSTIGLAASNLTNVSTLGDLAIEDIVVKSDATGLAGGTNLVISSTNVKGLANILVETVANLGANKTVNLDSASVTKQRTVLESGKQLQIASTVGACTGAGTIDVYIKCRRLAPGANLS